MRQINVTENEKSHVGRDFLKRDDNVYSGRCKDLANAMHHAINHGHIRLYNDCIVHHGNAYKNYCKKVELAAMLMKINLILPNMP